MILDGQAPQEFPATGYLELNRNWKRRSRVELHFEMGLRHAPGDREVAGRVSLYRGPLLLAYDQRFNSFDEAGIPPVDLRRLAEATLEAPQKGRSAPALEIHPWAAGRSAGRSRTDAAPLRFCQRRRDGNALSFLARGQGLPAPAGGDAFAARRGNHSARVHALSLDRTEPHE
jgi:hypothetical protein